MKILLVEHPRSFSPERCNDIANTPLSSCLLTGYAAGMLCSRGHEVEIVEGFLDRLAYRDIADRARAMEPDIVGLHMVYHWQRDAELFRFAEQVKEESGAFIAAYGFYPTIACEDILGECAAVDAVLLGEPETTFAALAEAVACKQLPRMGEGLAVRNGSGGVVRRPGKLIGDLDALPFPVRTEAFSRIPEVNIQGSRGCYGKCTFCSINPFYGQGSVWRGRSPGNIMREIDTIVDSKGRREFYFTDPNFFGPGARGQERALRIAALLKERGLQFGIEGRVNDIHDKTVAALVEAGLRHILIGLESGRDDSLKRLNKMTTVAQNERALSILRKHGIEPNVGFIMFEPDSSLKDIRANLEFLKRNELLKNLSITANVLYHHQIVLKGTPAYRRLEETGRLEVSGNSTYEGTASFIDPSVRSLASLMRRITNFLFGRMSKIWSGQDIEPIGAKERYAVVNRILVDAFEITLSALEAGAAPDNEETSGIAGNAEREIDLALKDTKAHPGFKS